MKILLKGSLPDTVARVGQCFDCGTIFETTESRTVAVADDTFNGTVDADVATCPLEGCGKAVGVVGRSSVVGLIFRCEAALRSSYRATKFESVAAGVMLFCFCILAMAIGYTTRGVGW